MTAPQKFVKRPVTVEAWQFVKYANGNTNGEEIAEWCGGEYHKMAVMGGVQHWVLAGRRGEAEVGDWVVKDAAGECLAYSPENFAAEFVVSQ